MRFLVDENLPRSLKTFLQNLHHVVVHVAETDLRGSTDEYLWELANREDYLLITRDLDFPLPASNISPPGILLIRVPETFTSKEILRLFAAAFSSLEIDELNDSLVVISPGRIRFRKLS